MTTSGRPATRRDNRSRHSQPLLDLIASAPAELGYAPASATSVPIAATPGILAMRAGMRWAGAASATLRALCVVALVAMLAGLRVPGHIAAQSVAVVAVMDESRSVSPDQQEWMRGRIEQLKSAMAPTDQLGIVGFGRDARLLAQLERQRGTGSFAEPHAQIEQRRLGEAPQKRK